MVAFLMRFNIFSANTGSVLLTVKIKGLSS